MEVENRELYLTYMEDVLKNKEKELFALEESLVQKQKEMDECERDKNVVGPVEMAQLA